MNRLLKTILTTFTIVAIPTLVVAATPHEVIGNILLLDNETMAFKAVAEETFETIEACWDFALSFNKESKGTGFLAMCWPLPDDSLGV